MSRNSHQINGRKALKIEIGGKWSPRGVTWYQLPEFFFWSCTQPTNFIQFNKFADLFDIIIELFIANGLGQHIAILRVLFKYLNDYRITWNDYKVFCFLRNQFDKIIIVNLNNIFRHDITKIWKSQTNSCAKYE